MAENGAILHKNQALIGSLAIITAVFSETMSIFVHLRLSRKSHFHKNKTDVAVFAASVIRLNAPRLINRMEPSHVSYCQICPANLIFYERTVVRIPLKILGNLPRTMGKIH